MTEIKKRKIHTSGFKAKVGLEALRSGKTINQISQEFGVHPIQVGQWKKVIQENAKQLFEGKRGPKPVDAQSEPEEGMTAARRAGNRRRRSGLESAGGSDAHRQLRKRSRMSEVDDGKTPTTRQCLSALGFQKVG